MYNNEVLKNSNPFIPNANNDYELKKREINYQNNSNNILNEEEKDENIEIPTSVVPAIKHVITARFNNDVKKINLLWEELNIPGKNLLYKVIIIYHLKLLLLSFNHLKLLLLFKYI